MYQHRRERLTSLIRDQYGGLRKALADASGWSEARISQILSSTYREGRAFSEKIARKLESDLSLPAMFFDHGAIVEAAERAAAQEFLRIRPINGDSPGVVQIRRVKLRLSAGIVGFSVDPDDEVGQAFNLEEDWIARNRYNPDDLIAIEVTGESMEPRLYRGDLVVVNTADKTPADGQVFAVNYEGEAVIKRLTRDAGHWWLTSDNPDQRRFPRKLCDGAGCLIVGRVVLKKSENI
ncbi:phage repressor protein C with HTH and peptisase S24 domain [Pseudoduganella flava]|uniref:Phage repressor protein C with HTH and peptisase S24 domain n=2 Tax=Pseudoduganella flava TaxID=871742 RepID=A0A562Q436_9BURK|nr:S24 family peptidase [Pseudoduganella flava]QGZ41541.1 S24 family peptidase [Pseudoduganella flava]TWI51515.1 phage repressor protein C with HTH and peptisase S24 domain [Pseudoduganella flava]